MTITGKGGDIIIHIRCRCFSPSRMQLMLERVSDSPDTLQCHGSCVSSWHDSSTWQTWHCHMLHHIGLVSHYSERGMRGLKRRGGARGYNCQWFVINNPWTIPSVTTGIKTNSVWRGLDGWIFHSQDYYSDQFVWPRPSPSLSQTLGQDWLGLGTVNHIFIFNLPALSPARPTKTRTRGA